MSLVIAQLYPNLLGTYGDSGNGLVLRARAVSRGLDVELLTVEPGRPVPEQADIYLLGGGEDAKQTAAAQMLRDDGSLPAAAARGAVVFGICAGYQLLGTTFLGVGGAVTEGLGLLDVTTDRLGERAVGNVLAHPAPAFRDRLDDLIGFENHGGATTLGPGAEPLGIMQLGVGNGGASGGEGAAQGNVFGTYLHGPALALNPRLADLLLIAVTGPLAPVDDEIVSGLRRHRLEHVLPQAERVGRRQRVMAAVGRRRAASGASATLSGSGQATPHD